MSGPPRRPERWRVVRLLAVLLLTCLALPGCASGDDETVRPKAVTTLPPKPPTDLPAMPVGTGHVGPGDRVQARGSILIVNGRATNLAPMTIDEFAVVHGGVFFRNGHELWFTDLTRVRATGFDDVQSVVASADGRRLAFLDLQHGPKDEFGTPLAISIAYDALTGTPLLASYAGMGDITRDALRGLYEGAEPRIVGFDGDALLVHGATHDYRIPLGGGKPERVSTLRP